MGNYTNKCSLFSTPSDRKANEWIHQAVASSVEVSCCIYIIIEEEAKPRHHRSFSHISHADLCKFLPRRLAPDWPRLLAPAQQNQEFRAEFAQLDMKQKGRQRAFRQLTSWGQQSSDVRKTPTPCTTLTKEMCGREGWQRALFVDV